MILHVNKQMKDVLASILLRSIKDSILLHAHADKFFKIKGFEMVHEGQTYETFLNLKNFDNLYDMGKPIELFSNRRGVIPIKHSNLQIDKITTILYELVEVDNT